MTPENFCYWLQGLLEVGQPTMLDQKQIQTIENHLKLVFNYKSVYFKKDDVLSNVMTQLSNKAQNTDIKELNITC
jgi:hypothetical protein